MYIYICISNYVLLLFFCFPARRSETLSDNVGTNTRTHAHTTSKQQRAHSTAKEELGHLPHEQDREACNAKMEATSLHAVKHSQRMQRDRAVALPLNSQSTTSSMSNSCWLHTFESISGSLSVYCTKKASSPGSFEGSTCS